MLFFDMDASCKSSSSAPKLVEEDSKSCSKFAVNVKSGKDKCQNDGGSEITIKEFLDFLKTAYQVNESLEGMLLAEGMTEAVDWIKLKESELVKPKNVSCQTPSTSKVGERKGETGAECGEGINKKLNEVLQEGLLDSVLPYLTLSPSRKQSQKKMTSLASLSSHGSDNFTRKKSTDSSTKGIVNRTDSEVVIHVCDELKKAKKDFVCNQKLLVDRMGYFAQVTAGQRLEDMDISVHCDIGIFEWLMRWVKKEQVLEEDRPQLDPQCVVPILVSAAFLQMEPLLEDCLLFCHRHMNEIIRTSTNLSCLNDSVLTSLAAMYTNAEVEMIRDKKDKIQSKLYCKLIQSLCEPESESVRGHWNSLAYTFRCSHCQQLVNPLVSLDVPCIPTCMRLQADGSIINHHVRDPTWNINEYVETLFKQLKSWRRVYWRLWGSCHFLQCTLCSRPFPANQIGWCRHHPDAPQFFTLDAQKAPLPVGRYPCCGERAYRFQLLSEGNGCRFREHVPCTENVQDGAIYAMTEAYRHLIEEEPPQLVFPERLTRLVARDAANADEGQLLSTETFWWDGIELVPPRPKLGLLGSMGDLAITSDLPNDLDNEDDAPSTYSDISSSESACSSPGSEESACAPRDAAGHKNKERKSTRRRSIPAKLWQHNLSARSNQDLQRCYEEEGMKKIAAILSRRTFVCGGAPGAARRVFSRSWSKYYNPPGGLWTRLEAEWRENQTLSTSHVNKTKNLYGGQKFKLFKACKPF